MTMLAVWQQRFDDAAAQETITDGSHDGGHFRRVWQNCRMLAAAENPGANPFLFLAAAYYHDSINPPKNSPDRARASVLSADKAVTDLRREAYPLTAGEWDVLHHMIAAHSFSANIMPQTAEAKIFQDADRLEALGAVGLARMFCVSGQLGRALWDQNDPLAERRAVDDKRFALDHVGVKLRVIATTMQTATGAQQAARRMAFMDTFIAQLCAEID